MANQILKFKCGICSGTGTDNNQKDENGNVVPESCIPCNGTGYSDSVLIDSTEVMDLLDWLKKKIKKILVKLELPED